MVFSLWIIALPQLIKHNSKRTTTEKIRVETAQWKWALHGVGLLGWSQKSSNKSCGHAGYLGFGADPAAWQTKRPNWSFDAWHLPNCPNLGVTVVAPPPPPRASGDTLPGFSEAAVTPATRTSSDTQPSRALSPCEGPRGAGAGRPPSARCPPAPRLRKAPTAPSTFPPPPRAPRLHPPSPPGRGAAHARGGGSGAERRGQRWPAGSSAARPAAPSGWRWRRRSGWSAPVPSSSVRARAAAAAVVVARCPRGQRWPPVPLGWAPRWGGGAGARGRPARRVAARQGTARHGTAPAGRCSGAPGPHPVPVPVPGGSLGDVLASGGLGGGRERRPGRRFSASCGVRSFLGCQQNRSESPPYPGCSAEHQIVRFSKAFTWWPVGRLRLVRHFYFEG